MAMRPTKCRCKTYKYSVVIPILSAPGDALLSSQDLRLMLLGLSREQGDIFT